MIYYKVMFINIHVNDKFINISPSSDMIHKENYAYQSAGVCNAGPVRGQPSYNVMVEDGAGSDFKNASGCELCAGILAVGGVGGRVNRLALS